MKSVESFLPCILATLLGSRENDQVLLSDDCFFPLCTRNLVSTTPPEKHVRPVSCLRNEYTAGCSAVSEAACHDLQISSQVDSHFDSWTCSQDNTSYYLFIFLFCLNAYKSHCSVVSDPPFCGVKRVYIQKVKSTSNL